MKKDLQIALQSVAGKIILEYIDKYVLDGNPTSLEGLSEIINLRRNLLKIQNSE